MINMHQSHEQEFMNSLGQGGAMIGGFIGSVLGPGGTVAGANIGYALGFLGAGILVAEHFREVSSHTQHKIGR